jgi:hypothetical protein
VKVLDNIKEKLATISLQKELKATKRSVAFNNFESSTTVGFIFDATDKDKYQLSREFMDSVGKLNNRIFAIAFASKSDQIAYFPFKQGVDYFGLDEVNWYGKPSNPVINDFMKRNFDILVDLSLTDIFPIQYIYSLSNARFKITNKSGKARYADFVIEVGNSGKLVDYISQIQHYIKVIKAKQA